MKFSSSCFRIFTVASTNKNSSVAMVIKEINKVMMSWEVFPVLNGKTENMKCFSQNSMYLRIKVKNYFFVIFNSFRHTWDFYVTFVCVSDSTFCCIILKRAEAKKKFQDILMVECYMGVYWKYTFFWQRRLTLYAPTVF